MTALADVLVRRIRATGPMTIADFMTECLWNPDHGYYATHDPLGADGDFVTAPDISQMFGECLGLALAQAWLDRGSPAPFTLAELGPGRGTLMADALRATKTVPGFHAAMRLVLVETSPVLRAAQETTLGTHDPTWVPGVSDLPDGPLYLVANEFFDALPIRQFLRSDAGWRERVVGLRGGRLAFGLTEPAPVADLAHLSPDLDTGAMVEISAPGRAIASEIGRRIATEGGVALIVDYGGWNGLGDTLQAVRGHQRIDPLDAPGDADLTAHVDFAALAAAAHPAVASRLVAQGVLLERLGITARATALAQRLSGARLDLHIAAHRRLTHPEEMGSLFQAMAIFAPETPCPSGFDI